MRSSRVLYACTQAEEKQARGRPFSSLRHNDGRMTIISSMLLAPVRARHWQQRGSCRHPLSRPEPCFRSVRSAHFSVGRLWLTSILVLVFGRPSSKLQLIPPRASLLCAFPPRRGSRLRVAWMSLIHCLPTALNPVPSGPGQFRGVTGDSQMVRVVLMLASSLMR